jgi:hypothetical protein
LSFSACWTAFTCSAPPAADLPDLPFFIAEPDFMSPLDEPEDIEPALLPEPAAPGFMSVEDEPAPVPELVAGDEPDVLLPVCGLAAGEDDELGLADGAFVSLPVLAGVFVSLLEPLPPVEVPVAPAPDEEPVAEPLAPLAPPLWANADVASIAPATVSAKALIHVFITILLLLLVLNVVRRRAQLAWRRSATFRTSCSAGGASTRASRGSVTGRPSRAER